MPIRGIPQTCTEILRLFLSHDDFTRTVRQKGIYYYRHNKYPRVRILMDQKNKTLTLRREYSTEYGARKESIIYNYKTKEISKLYSEPMIHNSEYRCRKYTLLYEEDKHFQQSLLDDKYYPTFEDMMVINNLYLRYFEDSYNWSHELKVKADARRAESAKAWEENQNNWIRQLMIEKNKRKKHESKNQP